MTRARVIHDVTAVTLLVLAVLLPWNVHVGFGIPETPGWVIALLISATVFPLVALAMGRNGDNLDSDRPRSITPRALLVLPYVLLVGAFVLVSVADAVRFGGNGVVAAGVGPGAWTGLAGAVLAARSPIVGDGHCYDRLCRVIGWSSMALGALAAVITLYLRTRYVVPGIGGAEALPNLTTAVVALLYSAVALLPVVLVGRWIVSGDSGTRLATVALGASAIVAGAVVWALPVGRQLDAFHCIAQRTGTAFVGYEGYLAWATVAAVAGAATLRSARESEGLWRGAIQAGLLLIAAWCGCQAVLRLADIVLAAVLELPTLPYFSAVLMAFDLLTAVLAGWLWVNSRVRAMSTMPTVLLLGSVFVLSVCRLILGVTLVPRVEPLNGDGANAVYGNHLSQQVTSTFDVTISVLSLVLLVAAVRVAISRPVVSSVPRPASPVPGVPSAPVPAAVITPGQPTAGSVGGTQPRDRIAEVLAQSTQRYAAGTTYRGSGQETD